MLKITEEVFPREDIQIFHSICFRISWLPERLDLAPRNDFERERMYDPINYNKMLLGGLSFEISEASIGLCTVMLGNPALLVDALELPGGSRVILGIPGSLSSGPLLLHAHSTQRSGIQFAGYAGSWDDEPDWFHRGIDSFREEFQNKMKMYENLPGPEGTRDDEAEITIQP